MCVLYVYIQYIYIHIYIYILNSLINLASGQHVESESFFLSFFVKPKLSVKLFYAAYSSDFCGSLFESFCEALC